MPTYEYQCPAGHLFEKFQKITDKPRAKCPKCGKPATRRMSGGAGLVFKGSGFYITDYGKGGKGPRKSEGPEGGAETKPAKEAEPKAEPAGTKKETPPAKKAKE